MEEKQFFLLFFSLPKPLVQTLGFLDLALTQEKKTLLSHYELTPQRLLTVKGSSGLLHTQKKIVIPLNMACKEVG